MAHGDARPRVPRAPPKCVSGVQMQSYEYDPSFLASACSVVWSTQAWVGVNLAFVCKTYTTAVLSVFLAAQRQYRAEVRLVGRRAEVHHAAHAPHRRGAPRHLRARGVRG